MHCDFAQTYTGLVPDDERGWCLLSEISTRLGEHEDALTAGLRAIDVNSESLDGLFHVGTALMSLSRNVDAEEYFHRSIPSPPALGTAIIDDLCSMHFPTRSQRANAPSTPSPCPNASASAEHAQGRGRAPPRRARARTRAGAAGRWSSTRPTSTRSPTSPRCSATSTTTPAPSPSTTAS